MRQKNQRLWHYSNNRQNIRQILGTVISPNPYIIQVIFFFKECKFHIMQIYCLSNDIATQKFINKYIYDHFKKYRKKNSHHIIIISDFNFIMNKNIDRRGDK